MDHLIIYLTYYFCFLVNNIKQYNSTDNNFGYNLSLGGNNKGSIAGKNNKLNKKIICLETKKIYPSTRIASQELKIDESCIRKVCKKER